MPYTLVPFTANYVEAIVSGLYETEEDNKHERSYDQRFLNKFLRRTENTTVVNFTEEERINLMAAVKFQFGKEDAQAVGINKVGNPTVKISTSEEYYDAVIAAALKQKVALTRGDVIAIFAFTFSHQSTFARWFADLNNPIQLYPTSTLEISVKKIAEQLQLTYVEKEKQIGDFKEMTGLLSSKAETVFKAKVQGSLKFFNNTYTYTPEKNPNEKTTNKFISIVTPLWEKNLHFSAEAYLKQTKFQTLDDLFVLTPFLIDPKFRTQYNEKLATFDPLVQDWAYHFIDSCFDANPSELKKILAAVPNARKKPVELVPESNGIVISSGEPSTNVAVPSFTRPGTPSPSSRSVINMESDSPHSLSSHNSTQPGGGRSAIRRIPVRDRTGTSTSPTVVTNSSSIPSTTFPPPPPLSLAEQYAMKKKALEILCTKQSYAAQQLASVQTLLNELNKLSENERSKHLEMLNNIMDCANIAVINPGDEANLNRCQLLIGPMRRESLNHLAMAIGLVVLGALLTVAATAVAVASFGGTTLFSSWGISVGTTALTKGLSIAGSVLGLGMMGGGLYWSTHQPLKKVIASADSITNKAVSFWKQEKNHEAYTAPVVLPVSPSRSRSSRS